MTYYTHTNRHKNHVYTDTYGIDTVYLHRTLDINTTYKHHDISTPDIQTQMK